MELQGPLWEGVLPGVLRQLFVGRRSGLLALTKAGEQRAVRFNVGNIVNVETNVREDRLGEVLVRQGLLTTPLFNHATGIVLRSGKRLGQVLLEIGVFQQDALRELIAFHVDAVLGKALVWTEGEYAFTEELGRPLDEHELTLPYSTGDLILRASRSVRDPDVVRYRLGEIDRLVDLSRDPLLRFQRLSLTAIDGLVLARVDGRTRAREIVQDPRLEHEELQASLFALLNTGVVEFHSSSTGRFPRIERPRPQAQTPAPAPAQPPSHAESVELVRGDEAGVHELPLPDMPTGPVVVSARVAALPPALPEPLEERRREIVEMRDALGTRSHFQLLGLAVDASDADVQSAYFSVAKRFHPDRHHEPGLGDLREALEAIFARLGEVYDVLRSPRLRARYETEELGIVRSTPPAFAPEAAPPAASGEREDRPAAAEAADTPEQAIEQAASSIAAARYWEALPLLEEAVPRASGAARQRGRILLAKVYARDPDWLEQAQELLEAARDAEPSNVEVHFFLGLIHEHEGRLAEALAVFRRVLELEPGSVDALAHVSELAAQIQQTTGPAPDR